MSTSRPLLTPGEAADLLRMPTARVTKLALAGEIPSVRLPGDEIRFDADDLVRFVDACKRPSGREGAR